MTKEKEFDIEKYFTKKEWEVINKHDSLVDIFYKSNKAEMKELYVAMLLFVNTLGVDFGEETECDLIDRVNHLQAKLNRLEKIRALQEKKS